MSKPNATEQLLTSLKWPKKHMNDKGRLSFMKPGDNDCVDLANVLVNPNQVKVRLARFWPDGPAPLHFEATWDISPDKDPVLKVFEYAGEPQPLNSDAAVTRFGELLDMLNAQPTFQVMGTRWKPKASSAPSI